MYKEKGSGTRDEHKGTECEMMRRTDKERQHLIAAIAAMGGTAGTAGTDSHTEWLLHNNTLCRWTQALRVKRAPWTPIVEMDHAPGRCVDTDSHRHRMGVGSWSCSGAMAPISSGSEL